MQIPESNAVGGEAGGSCPLPDLSLSNRLKAAWVHDKESNTHYSKSTTRARIGGRVKAEAEVRLEQAIESKRLWLAEERLRPRRAHLPPHELFLRHLENQLRDLRSAA